LIDSSINRILLQARKNKDEHHNVVMGNITGRQNSGMRHRGVKAIDQV